MWTEILIRFSAATGDYYIGLRHQRGYGYGTTLNDVMLQAALSTSENELLENDVYSFNQ